MIETVFGNSALISLITVMALVLSGTMPGFDADDFPDRGKRGAKVGVIGILCQFFHGTDDSRKVTTVVLKRSIDFIKLRSGGFSLLRYRRGCSQVIAPAGKRGFFKISLSGRSLP